MPHAPGRAATHSLLRLTNWNPMSLRTAGRVPEVSDVFSNQDVVVLPGTRQRATHGEATSMMKTSCHFGVSWGWARAPFSNSSAGVTIMIKNKRFSQHNVVAVRSPPKELQGRGGMMRITQGPLHIAVFGLYVPPFNGPARKLPAWKKAVTQLLEWTRAELDLLPARVTPILAMDLNSGLGMRRGQLCTDEAVGPHNIANENFAGFTFHELLLLHGLRAYNLAQHLGPTFIGTNGSSHIDMIAGPQALGPAVEDCKLCFRQGRMLQLSHAIRDHIPMSITFRIPAPQGTQPSRDRFDMDAICDCVQWGFGRDEFMSSLQTSFSSPGVCAKLAELAEKPTPDEHWRFIIFVLRAIALQHFSLQATRSEEREAERERRELTRRRAQLRASCADPSSDSELQATITSIRSISSKIRHTRNARTKTH